MFYLFFVLGKSFLFAFRHSDEFVNYIISMS